MSTTFPRRSRCPPWTRSSRPRPPPLWNRTRTATPQARPNRKTRKTRRFRRRCLRSLSWPPRTWRRPVGWPTGRPGWAGWWRWERWPPPAVPPTWRAAPAVGPLNARPEENSLAVGSARWSVWAPGAARPAPEEPVPAGAASAGCGGWPAAVGQEPPAVLGGAGSVRPRAGRGEEAAALAVVVSSAPAGAVAGSVPRPAAPAGARVGPVACWAVWDPAAGPGRPGADGGVEPGSVAVPAVRAAPGSAPPAVVSVVERPPWLAEPASVRETAAAAGVCSGRPRAVEAG